MSVIFKEVNVCQDPENAGGSVLCPASGKFLPVGSSRFSSPVILTVDEYETIRLIDRENLSQEECGAYMKIARTTVQQIYTNARRKLAEALVDGRPLKIEGGDYHLCDGLEESCGRSRCCHKWRGCPTQDEKKEDFDL